MALGCGQVDYNEKGYFNTDIRKKPEGKDHIQYEIDANEPLPIEDGQLSEILAESVLEHLPHNIEGVPDSMRMTNSIKVLREWLRVLKPGGKLIIKVPNLEGIFKQYIAKRISVIDLIGYIYGGGEYKENYHLAGFDKPILSACLRAAGAKKFEFFNAHNYKDKFNPDRDWEIGAVATK